MSTPRTWPAETHARPIRCAEADCGRICTSLNSSTPFFTQDDESPPVQTVLTARLPEGWSASRSPSVSQDPFAGAHTSHWCPDHSPPVIGDSDGFPASVVG